MRFLNYYSGLNAVVTGLFFLYLFTVSEPFANQDVNLLEDNNDGILLKFQLPEYGVADAVVKGEKCQSIEIRDGVYTSEKGAPRLPVFSQSIRLPDVGAMELEIISLSFREIQVSKIVPSRGVIYRNQNPADVPYVFGRVYCEDAWYPKETASLGRPFIMRDIRGAVVSFYPFQFNPVQGIIKVAESISVKVKPVPGPSINPIYSARKKISSAFNRMYQRRFINFRNSKMRYPEVNDGEKMIVITAADYKSSMEPFVAWKNRKGIETEMYEYPSQTGGSGADAVKGFIQQKYDADTVSYILLVGDAADIPSLEGFFVPSLSDPSFVKLAGDDHYPDAFIGRFSVEEPAQADQMVAKVLHYEKEPDPNGEWYTKAIGMACDMKDSTGVSDEDWIEEMNVLMENNMYTHIDRVFETESGTVEQVVEALNDGRGWFNYQGHGLQTLFGFANAYVQSGTFKTLENTDKLPVVICVACNTGEFDYRYECIAECATRLDKTGAIAFFASYIAQPFHPPQVGQKEIVRLLVEDTYISLGATVYNGVSKILETGNSEGEYLETFDAWTLFGDPTLCVINRKPTTMDVSCPENIETGSQELSIAFAEGVEGRVCLYSDENGILASEIIAKRDSVKLSVEIADEKKIHLTVTARNRIPVMKEIAIGIDGILDKTKNIHSDKFMVKRIGRSLMFYVPYTENGVVTVSDLHGRHLITFKTDTDKKWYSLPSTLSCGMHIASFRAHERVVVRKFLYVK